MTQLAQSDLSPGVVINFGTGNSTSDPFNWEQISSDAEAFSIFAPAALNGLTTLTLQASYDNVNWGDLEDNTGTPIKAPSAALAVMCYNGVISAVPWFRLKSATPATAQTQFNVCKSFRA